MSMPVHAARCLCGSDRPNGGRVRRDSGRSQSFLCRCGSSSWRRHDRGGRGSLGDGCRCNRGGRGRGGSYRLVRNHHVGCGNGGRRCGYMHGRSWRLRSLNRDNRRLHCHRNRLDDARMLFFGRRRNGRLDHHGHRGRSHGYCRTRCWCSACRGLGNDRTGGRMRGDCWRRHNGRRLPRLGNDSARFRTVGHCGRRSDSHGRRRGPGRRS